MAETTWTEENGTKATRTQKRIVDALRREADRRCQERPRDELTKFAVTVLDWGTVRVDGEIVYTNEDGSPGNGLNDSRFFALVSRRGKVTGMVFPGMGSTKEFTARDLYRVGIY